jgi:hypothetical protein
MLLTWYTSMPCASTKAVLPCCTAWGQQQQQQEKQEQQRWQCEAVHERQHISRVHGRGAHAHQLARCMSTQTGTQFELTLLLEVLVNVVQT